MFSLTQTLQIVTYCTILLLFLVICVVPLVHCVRVWYLLRNSRFVARLDGLTEQFLRPVESRHRYKTAATRTMTTTIGDDDGDGGAPMQNSANDDVTSSLSASSSTSSSWLYDLSTRWAIDSSASLRRGDRTTREDAIFFLRNYAIRRLLMDR